MSVAVSKRKFRIFRYPTYFITIIVFLLCLVLPESSLRAQDEYDEEGDAVEVFWGDEEDTTSYEDEYYDEYGDEDTTYYEDEYLDEYFDESEYDTSAEDLYDYGDESYVDEESADELTDTELADLAKRMGFTISFSGASPGFVNHSLMTYNSSVDYRVDVELPLLLQIRRVRFRFGAEIGTFSFKNYLPVGGEYSGLIMAGILTFPAGPGQVKLGGGIIGNRFGFIAENSYGFALGNTLEIRVGIRSTTVSNVKDTKNNDLGTVSWMDGLITLGFNL
ncbi:MAG: hypothetical protein GXO92_07405 [FCB group bacterium]|nr:hypothetical protein [FCB group bacterium]